MAMTSWFNPPQRHQAASVAATAPTKPYTPVRLPLSQLRQLYRLRKQYERTRDQFSSAELQRLRFVRYLVATGQSGS